MRRPPFGPTRPSCWATWRLTSLKPPASESCSMPSLALSRTASPQHALLVLRYCPNPLAPFTWQQSVCLYASAGGCLAISWHLEQPPPHILTLLPSIRDALIPPLACWTITACSSGLCSCCLVGVYCYGQCGQVVNHMATLCIYPVHVTHTQLLQYGRSLLPVLEYSSDLPRVRRCKKFTAAIAYCLNLHSTSRTRESSRLWLKPSRPVADALSLHQLTSLHPLYCNRLLLKASQHNQ